MALSIINKHILLLIGINVIKFCVMYIMLIRTCVLFTMMGDSKFCYKNWWFQLLCYFVTGEANFLNKLFFYNILNLALTTCRNLIFDVLIYRFVSYHLICTGVGVWIELESPVCFVLDNPWVYLFILLFLVWLQFYNYSFSMLCHEPSLS